MSRLKEYFFIVNPKPQSENLDITTNNSLGVLIKGSDDFYITDINHYYFQEKHHTRLKRKFSKRTLLRFVKNNWREIFLSTILTVWLNLLVYITLEDLYNWLMKNYP